MKIKIKTDGEIYVNIEKQNKKKNSKTWRKKNGWVFLYNNLKINGKKDKS